MKKNKDKLEKKSYDSYMNNELFIKVCQDISRAYCEMCDHFINRVCKDEERSDKDGEVDY